MSGIIMFNKWCCCFSDSGEPMQEPLVITQEGRQQLQYGGQDYEVPPYYKVTRDANFHGFFHENKSATKILGGWKFHISLDPLDINNVSVAWAQIIVPELLTCGIREFKIASLGTGIQNVINGGIGQGKLITVYLRHHPELGVNQPHHQSFINMLNTIEARLVANGIQPGPRPIIDYIVQDSRYMSFRCDARLPEPGTAASDEGYVFVLPDNHAISVTEERGTNVWNPYNFPDEYGLFDVRIELPAALNNNTM